MKVYSEPYNFLCIKIALAAEIGNVEIEFINPSTKGERSCGNVPKGFPYIELSSAENILFSPNSIIRYLLNDRQSKTIWKCEEWLDWESCKLFPIVIAVGQLHFSGTTKVPDELKKSLKTSLNYLNDYLLKNKRLSEQDSCVGAAEISIWSTLCIIFKQEKLFKEYAAGLCGLVDWWTAIDGQDATKKTLNRLLGAKDSTQFKDSVLSLSIPQIRIESTAKSNAQSAPIGGQPSSSSPEEDTIGQEELDSAQEKWYSPICQEQHRSTKPYPVLPVEGERNCLITSALPYVNNVPHLGNIIGAVLSADVFARYCRLRGYNVLYVCGTDEYGTATETKALEEGLSPQEICDKYNRLHKDIYDWFNISFDYFGRTSTKEQTEICQDIFWRLHANGYITKDTTEQLFCPNCSRFLADRFVEGVCPLCGFHDARGDQCDKCQKLINPVELINPRCKVCSKTPELRSSQHLYIDLPKLQPLVQEWMDGTCDLWSATAKVISQAWLKEGLKPRCITRDLKWGTPVPLEGFTEKVFYVWFDAPIGYLSMTRCHTGLANWERWWKNPSQVDLYQFMAKDNVAFHGVIFPATCIGAQDNYTKVKYLAAVEYLNYEETKFSKSRGTGVFGNQAQDTGIPSDIYRFYLLYIRPESQDTAFSWVDFMTKNNSELLNNLGNYINRATTFVYNNFEGKMPLVELSLEDKLLVAKVNREIKDYIQLMENFKLRDGVRVILNISRHGNQHIQSCKPWELIKGDEAQRRRAGSVMALSANVACLLAILMEPYMPLVAKELMRQLNMPMEKKFISHQLRQFLPQGHPINKPIPLFKKIEESQAEELRKMYSGRQESPVKEVVVVKEAASAAEIEAITLLVQKQGEKVRELKTAKAGKVQIDAEVAVLLTLKKQLIQLQPQPTNTSDKKKKPK